MEIITIVAFLTVAAITGVTTYFATKNAYNDEHEQLKAHINNQLIIKEERDNSHEFSQTVFIVLLAIVTACITVYITLKCVIQQIMNRTSRRQVVIQQPAQQNAQFEA